MENTEQEKHSGLKLFVLLVFITAYILLNVLGGGGDENLNLDNQGMITFLKVLQAAAVIVVFIVPSILFSTLWTKQKIHYLGITRSTSFKIFLIGGLGMLLAMPFINWMASVNQLMKLPDFLSGVELWMKNSEQKAAVLTEAFTKGTSMGDLALNLFVIAFMAALSEEIFFRGMLQKVLLEYFKNKHVAVWIGAALFSAIHIQFYGFIPRMIMGAYLGYLFLWSGSLFPSILAHFLNNGMAVFLAWMVNRNSIAVDIDKIGTQQTDTVLVIISLVLVVLSMYLVYYLGKKRLA